MCIGTWIWPNKLEITVLRVQLIAVSKRFVFYGGRKHRKVRVSILFFTSLSTHVQAGDDYMRFTLVTKWSDQNFKTNIEHEN